MSGHNLIIILLIKDPKTVLKSIYLSVTEGQQKRFDLETQESVSLARNLELGTLYE